MEDRRWKIEDGKEAAWRLFVAISLPEPVKDEIAKAQRELRDALPGDFVRWTKREQFHLTLKFLGNVAESRVTELIEALRSACLGFQALRLRAERIGFFPDMRFPRVVWAWVHDENEILPRLQNAIETSVIDFSGSVGVPAVFPGSAGVSPAGHTDDIHINSPGRRRSPEKFTGHVTLGRIQRIKRPQAEILAKLAHSMAERFFGEWMADKIELIRSELSSSGSHYTTLAAIPLATT